MMQVHLCTPLRHMHSPHSVVHVCMSLYIFLPAHMLVHVHTHTLLE